MFASLAQLLLTELEGSLRLRIGAYQIGLVTTAGAPGFEISVYAYQPPAAAAAASSTPAPGAAANAAQASEEVAASAA